jgi:hypothetical protein
VGEAEARGGCGAGDVGNVVPEALQQAAMTIPHKVLSRATYEDAEMLAKYAELVPRIVASNDFIARVTAADE